jgi:hypothetical protein
MPLGYREPPEPVWISDQGTRWRFTWLFDTHWFFSGLGEPDNGPMIGTYLGVGVPVRSRWPVRQEHGFGYAFDIAYRGFATDGSHRHRLAASGLVGKRVALFYQAAFGAAIYGFPRTFFQFAGPSIGGRVGVAFGRRRNYIMSIGGDLDIPARRYADAIIPVPCINLSLLTVGSL